GGGAAGGRLAGPEDGVFDPDTGQNEDLPNTPSNEDRPDTPSNEGDEGNVAPAEWGSPPTHPDSSARDPGQSAPAPSGPAGKPHAEPKTIPAHQPASDDIRPQPYGRPEETPTPEG